MNGDAGRFILGLEGPSISEGERALFRAAPPFGVILFARNLESAPQAAALIEELRSFPGRPLLFVDQEGGPVDRIGPLLGARFPSARRTADKGTDFVHENAYLMGRAARLLGFDVDFAPCLDLGPPSKEPGAPDLSPAAGHTHGHSHGPSAHAPAVVMTENHPLEGRTFGFHFEDVIMGGMMFLNGLARAGVASCLKHFPGLGRGIVDSHHALPVIEAHDVDLMVTDVAPFTKLASATDGVMIGHAAYPGFTGEGDETPASQSARILSILRGPVGFSGLTYSDDLTMNALGGTLVTRSVACARAGLDVLCLSRGFDAFEEAIAKVGEISVPDAAREARLSDLRRRANDAPRPAYSESVWQALAAEQAQFLERLERPRPSRWEG